MLSITRKMRHLWTPLHTGYMNILDDGPLVRREYDVETVVGQPQVNYRETITKKVTFHYLHKKQTGGSGQFARVMGFVEPIPDDTRDDNNELVQFEFHNRTVGANIPPEYISSVEKGEHCILPIIFPVRQPYQLRSHFASTGVSPQVVPQFC